MPLEDCPSCDGTGFICIDCGAPEGDCSCHPDTELETCPDCDCEELEDD
jgi:hypothetical protein